MPTTYSTSLRLSLIATGEQAGTWGTLTNTNLGTLLEQAIAGYVNADFGSDANYSLTTSNGSSDEARNQNLKVTSSVSLTATRVLIIPNVEKSYFIWNATTGSQTIRIGTSGAPSVYADIPSGYSCHVFCDGSDNVYQTTSLLHATTYNVSSGSYVPTSSTVPTNGLYLPSANVLGLATNSTARYYIGANGELGIGGATYGSSGQFLISGGTGSAPSWGAAVTSVTGSGGSTGLTLSGGPITSTGTLTIGGTLAIGSGGTGVTGTPTNGQLLIGNGSGYTIASLTAGSNITITPGAGTLQISASTSGGTVTSVGGSFTGGLISVSGSPVTSSGTLAFTVAGTSGGIPYFSSASGWASSSALAANAIVIGGGAGLAPSTTTTGSGVLTAIAQSANSTSGFITGSGSVTLTNKTISGATNTITNVSLTSGVTGTLPIANGGTALTSTPTNGQLFIGNGTNYTLAALTAGTGIGVSNGAGSITLSTSGAYTANGYTMSTARILGRTTASTGAAEEISIGSGLTLAAGSLSADAVGGITSISSGSLSSTAVSITNIPDTYSVLILKISGASCDTTTREILIRCDTDNGASFDTTAANYPGWAYEVGSFSNNTVASIIKSGPFPNTTTFDVTLVLHGHNSGVGHVIAQAIVINGSDYFRNAITWVKGSTSLMNALQILWNGTGSFDAGTWQLYGAP